MNELQVTYNGVANLYAIIRRTSDEFVWDGTDFVTWNDADITSYDVLMSNAGGDIFTADMPAIATDNYRLLFYERAGSLPSITDLLLKSTRIRWTGSSIAEPTDPGDPSSAYIDYNHFLRRWGTTNVRVASNLENATKTINKIRVQDAFDYSTSELHGLLLGSIYAVPLDFSVNNDVLPPRVIEWAEVLAYGNLYFARGLDERQARTSRVARVEQQVRAEIGLVRAGVRQLEAGLSDAVSSSGNGASVVQLRDWYPQGYGWQIINGNASYVRVW